MKRLLLVDDQSQDLLNASHAAESLGIKDLQAKSSIRDARLYLEKGLMGDIPLPDAIVVDLDLGMESGFELLRFWHSTPRLARIPIMVWSVVEEQSEICELFRVNAFVSKWQGVGAFREALGQLVSGEVQA